MEEARQLTREVLQVVTRSLLPEDQRVGALCASIAFSCVGTDIRESAVHRAISESFALLQIAPENVDL